jgi:hypothetical protein
VIPPLQSRQGLPEGCVSGAAMQGRFPIGRAPVEDGMIIEAHTVLVIDAYTIVPEGETQYEDVDHEDEVEVAIGKVPKALL